MNEECRNVRRALEAGGESGVAAHLSSCPVCAAHAEVLASLAHLAPGQADPDRVAAIMSALPPAPWRRTPWLVWLPLAAGFVFMAIGFLLLGGVPAPGAVAAMPHVASGALAWLGAAALDALAAVHGSADALHALVAAQGAWLVVALLLLGTAAGSGARFVLRGVRVRERS